MAQLSGFSINTDTNYLRHTKNCFTCGADLSGLSVLFRNHEKVITDMKTFCNEIEKMLNNLGVQYLPI